MNETKLPVEAKSELSTRVASALVLGTVALAVTWWGGLPFRLMMAALGLVLFYEWTTTTSRQGSWAISVPTGVLLIAVLGLGVAQEMRMAAMLVGAGAAAVLVFGLVRRGGVWPAAGLIYCAAPSLALISLRDGPDGGGATAGLIAVIFVFGVVWSTDIAAYFAGRAIGGPKLMPAVSPKKTWSGALGGTAGAIVAAVGVGSATGWLGILPALLLGIILSVLSQAGDLFESWIKRRSDVKDSSHLIPGHGGFMDRVDGLIFAAIALALVFAAAGWPSG